MAGEVAYSQFALEALLVETVARFDLEDCLYEFAGLSATIQEDDVVGILEPCGDGPGAVSWLLRASFFGLEVDEDILEYPDGEPAEKMIRVLAGRLESRVQRPARLRVHPAFRPYLTITDDDL